MVFSFLFLVSFMQSLFKSKTTIIHFSEHFIILNKEPDLKINSNNQGEPTVQTFLLKHFPNIAQPNLTHDFFFPHRLDYATSGILCIPKTKIACKITCDAFSSRDVKKFYIAIVRGLLSKSIIDNSLPIGEDNRYPTIQKMCTIQDEDFCIKWRKARTVIIKLEEGVYDGYPATKILCRLITGRRHQIRVHCNSLGHTIVGDYTYSNRRDNMPPRMYLHAIRLILPNPLEQIDISTYDPFRQIFHWKPSRTLMSLESGYDKIEEYLNSFQENELWETEAVKLSSIQYVLYYTFKPQIDFFKQPKIIRFLKLTKVNQEKYNKFVE